MRLSTAAWTPLSQIVRLATFFAVTAAAVHLEGGESVLIKMMNLVAIAD